MPHIVQSEHAAAASHLRSLLAKYREIEMLVQIGEYKPGSDALADSAIEARTRALGFLNQAQKALEDFDRTVAMLRRFSR